MQKFPNVRSQEWASLRERTIKMSQEFKDIRDAFRELYSNLDFEQFNELGGKRQPKIVMKLFNYTGDITPTMLLSLVKDVESSSN